MLLKVSISFPKSLAAFTASASRQPREEAAGSAAGQERSELVELQVCQQTCIIAPAWPRRGYTQQSTSAKTHHEQEKMVIAT